MKVIIVCVLLFASFFGYAQVEQTPKFISEQIIHPDCENSDNPNNCLRNIMKKIASKGLANLLQRYSFEEDTIKTSIGFNVDRNGKVASPYFIFTTPPMNIMFKDSIVTESVAKLPNFRVVDNNKTTGEHSHVFHNHFFLRKTEKEQKLYYIKNTKEYTGSFQELVPVFKGCSGTNEELRSCFMKKMNEHIIKHFRYPNSAQIRGIQGKVIVNFNIGETGEIVDLTTKGPDKILEAEAKRIINKLPKMTPGKQNLKPVKVPFSIPITFKLSNFRF